MKRKDITQCIICGEGLAKNSNLTFYKVETEYHVFDMQAIQQEHGLEQYFGGGRQGAILANVMGPDPELSKIVNKTDGYICLECALRTTIVEISAKEK